MTDPERAATDPLRDAVGAATAALAAIADPVARYRAAERLQQQIDAVVLHARRTAVLELREQRGPTGRRMPWRTLGDLLHITGSRAEQLATGRTKTRPTS